MACGGATTKTAAGPDAGTDINSSHVGIGAVCSEDGRLTATCDQGLSCRSPAHWQSTSSAAPTSALPAKPMATAAPGCVSRRAELPQRRMVLLVACGARTPLDSEEAAPSVSEEAGAAVPLSTFCDGTWAHSQICFGWIGTSPTASQSRDTMCQQQGGTVMTSCPAEGQLGCCAFVRQGLTAVNCWYCGDQSSWQAVCENQYVGSWTPGSDESSDCGG